MCSFAWVTASRRSAAGAAILREPAGLLRDVELDVQQFELAVGLPDGARQGSTTWGWLVDRGGRLLFVVVTDGMLGQPIVRPLLP
jgi:hypothetical protein